MDRAVDGVGQEQTVNAVSQEDKRQRENGLPTADFLDLRFRLLSMQQIRTLKQQQRR